jgi:hypothetical protein
MQVIKNEPHASPHAHTGIPPHASPHMHLLMHASPHTRIPPHASPHIVFEGPTTITGKKPEPSWTELEKTKPRLAVLCG